MEYLPVGQCQKVIKSAFENLFLATPRAIAKGTLKSTQCNVNKLGTMGHNQVDNV